MSRVSQIDAEEGQNILSVSQVSAMIQNTLTQEFANVRIKGEISGLKHHTSGHIYFNLKDEGAVINAICWRGTATKLRFKLEEGLEVVIYGNVNTYPARSNYQVICNDIEVAGLGALMALLEERKKKLAAEGLFDVSRKKPLPYMPTTIGVITSPTGAVIKDILHRISERFGVHVLVYPVAVQGEGAAEQVAEAIDYFDRLPLNSIPRPDVLIVARGGGSIEDLWTFNEEIVVRAVADCNIPLISAVGHETDTTLIDLVSDRRAPTPTAAAEMAVPVKAEIISYIMDLKKRSFSAVARQIENLGNILKARAQGLISPKQMLANMAQRLDDLSERMNSNINFAIRNTESKLKLLNSQLSPLLANLLKINSQKVESIKQLLESYNYKNVMKRGYSLVKLAGGGVVKSASALNSGDLVNIEFFDGSRGAVIDGNGEDNENKSNKTKSRKELKNKTEKISSRQKIKQPDKPTDQGSLF